MRLDTSVPLFGGGGSVYSTMNAWELWLTEVTHGESARSIASKIGSSPTSISNWNASGRPPMEAVLKIARGYDADLLAGLAAAGSLTEQDVADVRGRALLAIPTRDLIAELHARGSRSSERGFYDPPTDPTRWPASS